MIAAKARGFAGAILAAGALTATLLIPRPLADAQVLPAVEPVLAETAALAPALAAERPTAEAPRVDTEPEPVRSRWERVVQALLAVRSPNLPARQRIRLAAAIVDESERARLDPVFVLAIIEVESAYDTSAESEVGALGLMQLLPATMRREAELHGLDGDDPYDPVLNVQAGIRYYRRLRDAFSTEDLALMAYNAGPNRIGRYLRSGGVPERFHEYPRRVRAKVQRLKREILARKALLAASEDIAVAQ